MDRRTDRRTKPLLEDPNPHLALKYKADVSNIEASIHPLLLTLPVEDVANLNKEHNPIKANCTPKLPQISIKSIALPTRGPIKKKPP